LKGNTRRQPYQKMWSNSGTFSTSVMMSSHVRAAKQRKRRRKFKQCLSITTTNVRSLSDN